MPTLSIRFTGGHYHATPWFSAQNEGAVEWPPSPWRILRALIATGYAKLPQWQSGVMPPDAAALLGKLANVLPSYRLPSAVGAHTRHYMPLAGDKTTLVLDARAVLGVGHSPLLVHWPVALSTTEEQLLATLAEALGYLGRAEAWCEATLETGVVPDDTWSRPASDIEPPLTPGWEQLSLMAPMTTDEYALWHEAAAKKATKKSKAAIPPNIVTALQCETGTLQKQGWTQPPGSRLALYWRPVRHALGTTRPKAAARPERPPVPFLLLALSAAARSRSPMPVAARTLPQAELLHRAIASHVGRFSGSANEQAAQELLGKNGHSHQHAHILPLGLLKQDNHLDHILLWAPGGFGDASQKIVRKLRATYMKGGVGDLGVHFVGGGEATDFNGFAYLRPILATASIWQSVTPLVLPRFRKKSGKNTIEGQIAAELASRGLPEAKVDILEAESKSMRHYVRSRRTSRPPEDFGYSLRLTFATPISGPLALGYASHFGLGLFAAVPADSLRSPTLISGGDN